MYFSPQNLQNLTPVYCPAPQALNSVLPVVESLVNKEMRTFGRICAHQSTSEIINNLVKKRNKASFSQLLCRCGAGGE